jgi:hypothetical protein
MQNSIWSITNRVTRNAENTNSVDHNNMVRKIRLPLLLYILLLTVAIDVVVTKAASVKKRQHERKKRTDACATDHRDYFDHFAQWALTPPAEDSALPLSLLAPPRMDGVPVH